MRGSVVQPWSYHGAWERLTGTQRGNPATGTQRIETHLTQGREDYGFPSNDITRVCPYM